MRIIYALGYLIVGGLAGFAIQDRLSADAPSTMAATDPAACAAEVSRLAGQIKVLEAENQKLHQEYLEALTQKKALVSQNRSENAQPMTPVAEQAATAERPSGNSQSDAAQKRSEELAAVEYAHSFAQSLANKILTKPNFSLSQDLEQEFLKQDVDPTSPAHEDQLYELFNNNADLRQLALDSIQCRSESCQVTLLTADIEAADRAREALITAITPEGAASPVVIAAPRPGDPRLDLYIARSTNKQ